MARYTGQRWLGALLLHLLVGCGNEETAAVDPESVIKAYETMMLTDAEAGIARLQAETDPYLRTAAIVRISRLPGLQLKEEQVNRLCGMAASEVVERQCDDNYQQLHLRQYIDQEPIDVQGAGGHTSEKPGTE